jgi:hypothetical protein
MLVRGASPLIAIFYLAAIVERVLGYGLRERSEGGPVVVNDRSRLMWRRRLQH